MAQEFNTRLISVAIDLLGKLNVPFTNNTLRKRLESNPYFPSLFSLRACAGSCGNMGKGTCGVLNSKCYCSFTRISTDQDAGGCVS